MHLYRLKTSCEGEYDCDNHMGIFKTKEGMISFLTRYVKKNSGWHPERFENVLISLDKNHCFVFDNINEDDFWEVRDFKCEIINTDDLD